MNQLKKKSSKVVAFLLALAMVATSVVYTPDSASAASKKVTSVKITKPSTSVLVLKKGKTYKMKVKVTAKKSKYKKVTYKSSKKKVATVSKSGKIKALKKGTAKITVTSKTDKKKKATLTVKVGTPISKVTLTGTRGWKTFAYVEVVNQDKTSPEYGKVTIVRKSTTHTKRAFTKKTSATVTVTQGDFVTLKPNFSPSKATYKKVKYTVSNRKIASVTSTGLVTTKEVGTTYVYATARDGSGKKAKVKIKVNPFVETTTPAPTAVPDNSKTTVVENFEKYDVNSAWDKYTENSDKGQTKNCGTMTVVEDPLDPTNKVLKVDLHGTDAAYDFSPYFNVDLTQIPNAKSKLGDYRGIRYKVRVVSDIGDVQYKSIYGYFADYGTINKNMANCCGYNAAESTPEDWAKVLAEPERYKFRTENYGMIGEKKDNTGESGKTNNYRNMPEFQDGYFGTDEVTEEATIADSSKRTEGFAGWDLAKNAADTAEYAKKILDFDRASENCAPYLEKNKFDMTFGTTYAGQLKAEEHLEYYIDDIELVEAEGEIANVPATEVVLDKTELEIEAGEPARIDYTLTPAETTDLVTLTSSDENVATVSMAKDKDTGVSYAAVRGVAEGEATITVKANENVSATCKVTVKAASETTVITQNPTAADQTFNQNGADAEDGGVQFDTSTNDYAGIDINLPSEITDFSKCKEVKFTFAMSNGADASVVKFTIAAIHKDATSNYDETRDDKGRLYETYRDVTYGAAEQQDNITYDPATGLYTISVSLVGQSNMDKVKALMFARNGSSSASAVITLKQIDYTMKADGEADPTDAYPYVTIPFAQDYNDAAAITSESFFLPGGFEVEYKEADGVDGTGCVLVPADEYNGPAVLLDNRKGAEDKDFYVEAMVKAATEESLDGLAMLYAGYSSYVGFAKGGTVFDQIYLKNEWNKIHDKVTVPAGAFVELRFKGNKAFLIDNIKIEDLVDQDITDDDYPEAEPVDHLPFGSNLSVDLTQEAGGYGFTATATEGGMQYAYTQQYGEVKLALPTAVSVAMTDSITVDMTATQNCAIKLFDENGTQVGETAWNNQSEVVIDLSTMDKALKVGSIGIMSQDAGDTTLVVKAVTTKSTKMTADMTQEAGGYGFTATATEGGMQYTYTQQYGEVKLALPQNVTIADAANLVVDMTSTANCAIKLFDENGTQIGETAWNNQSEVTVDLSACDPTAKIGGIGIMSQDAGDTVLVVKSVTVNASTSVKADLTQEADGYGFTAAATEGGMQYTYTQQYGEVKLVLPQACSIAEFASVLVKMTSTADCAIKLYDENGTQVGDAAWNNTGDVTIDLSGCDQTAKIGGIGIMSQTTGETVLTVTGFEVIKK